MKYLKKFYESKHEDVVKYIQDIFLQSSDDGIVVDVSHRINLSKELSLSTKVIKFMVGDANSPYSLVRGNGIYVIIGDKHKSKSISYYLDSLHHLISYMKEGGYNIYDFTVVLSSNVRPGLKTINLYVGNKPANSSVKVDPLGWLQRFFLETKRFDKPISQIYLSFSEK